MKRPYFESYLVEHRLADEWWVSADAQVLERVMSLDEIAELEYELPGRVIALMHPAVADNPDSHWVTFEFSGMDALQSATITEVRTPEQEKIFQRLDRIDETIAELRSQVSGLRVQVEEMMGILHEVLQMRQMKEELYHRQQFIEAGEESLLAKTIRYEEQMAELDQHRDDRDINRVRSA